MACLYQTSAQIAKCLHQLVGLTNVRKTKGKRKEAISLEESKKQELTILENLSGHQNIKRLLMH